jgi:hypothetical protein
MRTSIAAVVGFLVAMVLYGVLVAAFVTVLPSPSGEVPPATSETVGAWVFAFGLYLLAVLAGGSAAAGIARENWKTACLVVGLLAAGQALAPFFQGASAPPILPIVLCALVSVPIAFIGGLVWLRLRPGVTG